MCEDNKLIEKTVQEAQGLGFEIKEVKEMNIKELNSIKVQDVMVRKEFFLERKFRKIQ